MSLVQQYKGILDRLYTAALPRREDEGFRSQLADLWFKMDETQQNEVQAYSVTLRKR